jgi:hypothetical protein
VEREERDLDFSQREIVLRADFDHLDREDCLWASMRFLLKGPRPPRAGEWVYLLSPTGEGCLGQVEEISGWNARVRPDWTSWAGHGAPPGS